MNFGQAIEAIKNGKRATRPGWNGKGMWIGLHNPEAHTSETKQIQAMTLPFIYLRTAGEVGHLVPWLASQTDMLAEDWEISAG